MASHECDVAPLDPLERSATARDSHIRELTPRAHADTERSRLSPQAAARHLIEALVQRGIDTFFGIPGGPICPVFEAIRLHPDARLIESRHESHAAFAATAYHRTNGRVPCVVVTAGPGITNAVTGVASASLERTPMLIIAGDVAWASSGGRMAQDSGPEGLAAESLYASITRVQVRSAHPRSVVSQALAALDVATDELHPGPALFVLPLDHAMAECAPLEVSTARLYVDIQVDAERIEVVARALLDAVRPLLVIGAGCRGHEAKLRALVDAADLPFVTTPRAKGLVSERHPRSLRNGGMAASMWARRYTAGHVDVCVALGTDLDDTSVGMTPYVGRDGRLYHVDLDASVFGRNLATTLGLRAEVGTFVDALTRTLMREGGTNDAARAALRDAKSISPFDVPEAAHDESSPVRPHRLLSDLQRAAGPDARFVTDIGEHMLFCLHYLTAADPSQFQMQLNLGSMGSGIASAIGIAIADPTRRVVCVTGDGCMQMSGMEALVAVRERLPVLFVVFNDGRYNMVHHGMRQLFGHAAYYDTPPVDFAAWARALGMQGLVVSRPAQITKPLIDQLLAGGGPALIDARIDASVRIRGGGRVEALQQMSLRTQGGSR